MNKANWPKQEPMNGQGHHHLLCWKSTFAGLFIALMAFMMLLLLGSGIAGFTAESMINREEGGSALATGAGLWMGLSAVISLFCGSYFALRISRFLTAKVGAAHGFVIASLFFFLMVLGAGSAVGGLVQGLGQLTKSSASETSQLASSPYVQDAMNRALGTSTLHADPRTVAEGLATRLASGDTESAKAYLAYQTGQSPADVDAKIMQLKSEFDGAVKKAGEKTAHAVGDASLSLFVIFLVGLIGAVIGGRVGAHSNVDRPFAAAYEHTPPTFMSVGNQRGSALPYLIGWLLGVPVSVLVLIAMLRAIF